MPPILQTELHRPVKENLKEFFEVQVDIEKVATDNPELKNELGKFLIEEKLALGDIFFLHFVGRYSDSLLAFTKDGNVVGALHSPYR